MKIISEFPGHRVDLVMRSKCSYCHRTGYFSLFFLDAGLLYCVSLGYCVVLVINLAETCVLPKELFIFGLSDCLCLWSPVRLLLPVFYPDSDKVSIILRHAPPSWAPLSWPLGAPWTARWLNVSPHLSCPVLAWVLPSLIYSAFSHLFTLTAEVCRCGLL